MHTTDDSRWSDVASVHTLILFGTVGALLVTATLMGCSANPVEASHPQKQTSSSDDTSSGAGAVSADSSDSGGSGTVLEDTGAITTLEADDATILEVDLPSMMSCGETRPVSVVVRNMGSATWTRDDGYKLGAVDDDDPFYTSDTRVWIPEGESIETHDLWAFQFELIAPEEEGTYRTDWQMVHESVGWFGDQTEQEIVVVCDASSGTPDLDTVTWLHSDVSGWAETGTLSSVSISGDNICLDYDKADTWTVTDYNGTDVVGNPWIFIWEDETWYAATWEWLRPSQTCKSLDAVAGTHIKQDPFGKTSGWVPTSGQTYWFMVSGLARTSLRNNEERTNLIAFVWP